MYSYKLLASSLLIVAVLSCVQAAQKRYDGDKVFRIIPESTQQLHVVRQFLEAPSDQFDFWAEPSFVGQSIDLHVGAQSVAMLSGLLNATKIPNKIMIQDLQKMIDEVNAKDAQLAKTRSTKASIVGTFPTTADTYSWLKELCSTNAELATCGVVGQSYEKLDIMYIKLGKPGSANKKKIWLEGTMHAREWLSTATVVYLVDRLLSTDATAKRLLDTYDWYVIPISNPDGYEYSQKSERLWRKTRSKSTATCYGADPNRNWAYKWGTGGSSASSCSDTYRGSSAFSEPETKAISDFITANKANSVVYFSLHTYSQYWLLPYGIGDKPSDYTELLRVGTIGTNALQAVNNKKWKVGNIIDLLYEASGGSIDWAKAVAGITYTYCLELRPASTSLNGFVVSTSEIDPSGREVWAGLVAAIDAIPTD